jgi:ribosomal protein L37AE/L43A
MFALVVYGEQAAAPGGGEPAGPPLAETVIDGQLVLFRRLREQQQQPPQQHALAAPPAPPSTPAPSSADLALQSSSHQLVRPSAPQQHAASATGYLGATVPEAAATARAQQPSSRTAFFLSVPSHRSSMQLCEEVGLAWARVTRAWRVRNVQTSQHSVVLELENEASAQQLVESVQGTLFEPRREGNARIAGLVASIRFFPLSGATMAPALPAGNFAQLPACPRCFERLDPSVTGLVTHVRSRWLGLRCPVCTALARSTETAVGTCPSCESGGKQAAASSGLWICLICGFVACGRYEKSHMVTHFEHTRHRFTVDMRNGCVWDYEGDVFVHRVLSSPPSAPAASASGALATASAASASAATAAATAAAAATVMAAATAGVGSAQSTATSRPSSGSRHMRASSQNLADHCETAPNEEWLHEHQDLMHIKLQSIASHYNNLLAAQIMQQADYFEKKIAQAGEDGSKQLELLRERISRLSQSNADAQQLALALGEQVKALAHKVAHMEATVAKAELQAKFLRDLNATLREQKEAEPPEAELERREREHHAELLRIAREKDKTVAVLQKRVERLMLSLSGSRSAAAPL